MKQVYQSQSKRNLLLVTAFFILVNVQFGFGQLFQQNFNSSSTLSNYYNAASPTTGQFNAIGQSAPNATAAIVGNALKFSRTTTGTTSFSRSTDLSPIPPTMKYSFSLSVNSTTAAASVASFQVGTGFTNTNGGATSQYAKIVIDFKGTGGGGDFALRNGSTVSATFASPKNISWYLNNSGVTINYLDPSSTSRTLANDKMDVYVGTTLVFSGVSVSVPTSTMSDLKFSMTGGTGSITLDDILIDLAIPYASCPPATVNTN